MSEALVISLQYNNFPSARLNGCFYDGERIVEQLKKIDSNMKITVMRDDLEDDSLYPTKRNILSKLEELCKSKCRKLYFYYSGHGSYRDDIDKDELGILSSRDGLDILRMNTLLKDSCLVSNDRTILNLVSDDELNIVLRKLRRNQVLFSFMDACHSGTMLDLYSITAGDIKSINSVNSYRNVNELVLCGLRNPIKRAVDIRKRLDVPGHVIMISGTRDNAYAYESNNNGICEGHFTTALVKALDLGLYRYNLRIFYCCLISLLNSRYQIPVLTSSKHYNINRLRMYYFFNTKSRLSQKQKLLLLKNK